VVPGLTETPLVTAIIENPVSTTDLLRQVPLGRPGTVRDIEGIMVYLASDESAYATGAIFAVDGGLSTL
jgi:NAD(P)-dependent dehydrogenase (short-subunit alcohol dehydrogenase family)